MAIVVSIKRVQDSLEQLGRTNVVVRVQLANPNTTYRDGVTGWSIRGTDVQELPSGTPSQPLLKAIIAGRFVRVPGSKGKGSKVDDLIDYLINPGTKAKVEDKDNGKDT